MDDLSGERTLGGGAAAGSWTLAAGEGLGGYRVVRALGRGGMGEVYEAEHVELGRRVALKLMRPDVAARPGFAGRFRQEGRLLARLDHPGIVSVFDMRSDGGNLFIVTEYVAGPDGEPLSLARELVARGTLAEDEVRRLALEMCEALGSAHASGVLHRDLKPGNVLLDAERRARLTDFGLAKVVGPDASLGGDAGDLTSALTAACPRSLPGSVLGTPEYMSPEQASGGEIDERSDVFSFGVMLYRMLTGRRVAGIVRMPSKLGCSVAWDAVVERALAPEPDERYAGVGELAAELKGISGKAPPRPPPREEEAREVRPRRERAAPAAQRPEAAASRGRGADVSPRLQAEIDALDRMAGAVAPDRRWTPARPAVQGAARAAPSDLARGAPLASTGKRSPVATAARGVGDAPGAPPAREARARRARGGHASRKGGAAMSRSLQAEIEALDRIAGRTEADRHWMQTRGAAFLDELSNVPQKKRCFIATAACGGADSPEVRLLRRYRDAVLLRSGLGRLVVGAYYRLSPPLARWISRRPRVRAAVRSVLVFPAARMVGTMLRRKEGPKRVDVDRPGRGSARTGVGSS